MSKNNSFEFSQNNFFTKFNNAIKMYEKFENIGCLIKN